MSASMGWAIVEIMGHRRHVGITSEIVRFGITMLQVDAVVGNDINERRTYLYPGSALFGVSPITEEEARREVAPYTPVMRQLPAAPKQEPSAEQTAREDANRWGWIEAVLRQATFARVSGALDKAGSGAADLSDVQRAGLVSLSATIAVGIARDFIGADGEIPLKDEDDDPPDSEDPLDDDVPY